MKFKLLHNVDRDICPLLSEFEGTEKELKLLEKRGIKVIDKIKITQ